MNYPSLLEPISVFKCPHCGAKVFAIIPNTSTPISGETYSDGFFFSPMQRPVPMLTKHCFSPRQTNFFWLETVNRSDGSDHPKPAAPLSLTDFCLALGLEALMETFEKELYIRENIWWNFNHRQRKGSFYYQPNQWGRSSINDNQEFLLFNTKEKKIWNNNLERLLEMYDVFDEADCLKIAEIYRINGEFDRCMSLIESLTSNKYSKLASLFAMKCEVGDMRVFSLSHGLPTL